MNALNYDLTSILSSSPPPPPIFISFFLLVLFPQSKLHFCLSCLTITLFNSASVTPQPVSGMRGFGCIFSLSREVSLNLQVKDLHMLML